MNFIDNKISEDKSNPRVDNTNQNSNMIPNFDNPFDNTNQNETNYDYGGDMIPVVDDMVNPGMDDPMYGQNNQFGENNEFFLSGNKDEQRILNQHMVDLNKQVDTDFQDFMNFKEESGTKNRPEVKNGTQKKADETQTKKQPKAIKKTVKIKTDKDINASLDLTFMNNTTILPNENR